MLQGLQQMIFRNSGMIRSLGNPNTDWYKEVYKPFSLENYSNVNLTGGTDNLKYYVSIGRRYQDAVYRNSVCDYLKVDFHAILMAKFQKISTSALILPEDGKQKFPINVTPEHLLLEGRISPSHSARKPTEVAWWWNALPD